MDTPAEPTVLEFCYSDVIGCIYVSRVYRVSTKANLREYSTKQQFRDVKKASTPLSWFKSSEKQSMMLQVTR